MSLDMLAKGFYTFKEAARYTQLRSRRVSEWFRGRPRELPRRPLFQGDHKPVDDSFSLSFHDLVDVYVAGQLREHGVPLQTVRGVYERLRNRFGVAHPFCRKELLTDGKLVFLENEDGAGRVRLQEVLTGQGVFPQIILPFLQKIDYATAELLAIRWRIAEGVVIDPAFSFGRPIVQKSSIATAVLAAAYYGNQKDEKKVALWYNIHPSDVLLAVQFEGSLAA